MASAWWGILACWMVGTAAGQGTLETAAATAWLTSSGGVPQVRTVTIFARELPGMEGTPTTVEPGDFTSGKATVAAASGWVARSDPKAWGSGRRIRIEVEAPVHPWDVPQAGLAVALAVEGVVTGEGRDAAVGLVGGLEPADGDGVIRLAPAPGIGAKIREARGRLRVLVIPSANREDLADLLVTDGTRPWLGVQVVMAEDVTAARRIALAPGIREGFLEGALRLFDEVRTMVGTDPVDDRFRQREVYDRLRRIVELEPGHASARMLLAVADGRVPARLSLTGSLRILASGSRALELEDRDALAKAEFAIRRQRSKLAEDVLPVWDALLGRVEILKRMKDLSAAGTPNSSAMGDLRVRLREAEQRYERNEGFLAVLPEVQEARARLEREP